MNLKQHLPKLLYILPAIAFAAAGAGKLSGTEMMHQSFATMGLPGWFGYFIGAAELSGAVGLMIPRLRMAAAAGLIAIMLGAVYFHIAYAVPSAVPAIVLTLLLVATIWHTRSKSEKSA